MHIYKVSVMLWVRASALDVVTYKAGSNSIPYIAGDVLGVQVRLPESVSAILRKGQKFPPNFLEER